MGVKHGSDVLYHLTGLKRADCAAIIRGLYEEKIAANKFTMPQPTIDGDSNNICYVVASKASNKSICRSDISMVNGQNVESRSLP
jgi:hypothetical protein